MVSTIPIESNTALVTYDYSVTFNNIKTQINPKTDEIEEYGVAGDVAGIIVSKLNSNKFSEISGITNSEIKNILAINQYTFDEFIQLQEKGINIVARSGDNYYIKGNIFQHPTSDAFDRLNVYLIYLYSVVTLKVFLELIISEDENIEIRISAKLNQIKNSLENYISGFDYLLDISGNTITIDLYENINRPISRMKFIIDFL